MKDLPNSVKNYEDHHALCGLDETGTLFHQQIIHLLCNLCSKSLFINTKVNKKLFLNDNFI